MTTSTPAKPRRRRAKRTRKPAIVVMNQQTTPTNFEGVNLVKDSHLPDIQVLDRNAIWRDIQNRGRIHNYEFSQAMKDLRSAVQWTNDNSRKVVDRIKSVEIQ